jgi:glycosyltransferase involved in cell wall biosynthesis
MIYNMKVSVIIPAYNEEKTVKLVAEKVKSLKLPIKKEIIVVDDGSVDNSWEIISKINGVKKIRHLKNRGKGAAVRSGIEQSTGDIIIIQDADLELDPKELPKIISPLIKNKAKVVYGSRNIYGKGGRSILFYFGGHLITFFTNLLFGTHLTDEPCGYKAFDSRLIKSIHIDHDRFEWEPEVTAKIAKKGIRIHEVPIVASSRSIEEGKKLRRRDGVKALLTLIKYRFFD